MFEQVQKILSEQFEVSPDTITMSTSVVDDLGADSLDVVELIMALEDEYGVTISDDEAAQLVTVSKIVEYLERLG